MPVATEEGKQAPKRTPVAGLVVAGLLALLLLLGIGLLPLTSYNIDLGGIRFECGTEGTIGPPPIEFGRVSRSATESYYVRAHSWYWLVHVVHR